VGLFAELSSFSAEKTPFRVAEGGKGEHKQPFRSISIVRGPSFGIRRAGSELVDDGNLLARREQCLL